MKKNIQIALVLATMVAFGCAKKREAAFPDGGGEQIFSIEELSSLNSAKGGSTVSTMNQAQDLSIGHMQDRALYEKGVTVANAESFTGPARLKFMFEELDVFGKPGQTIQLAFALGAKFLTVYKVTNQTEDLTAFEKAMAMTPAQLSAEMELQKTKQPDQVNQILSKLQEARQARPKSASLTVDKSVQTLLIPMFKYKIEDFGVVERTKNELKEETATLKLRKTKWTQASHVKITNDSASRIMILPSAAKKSDQEEVFVADRVKGPMSAGDLRESYGVVTSLKDDVMVTLNVTEASLQISEVSGDKAIPRAEYPLTFVRLDLPPAPTEGSSNSEIAITNVAANLGTGLVRIPHGTAKDVAGAAPTDATTTSDLPK